LSSKERAHTENGDVSRLTISIFGDSEQSSGVLSDEHIGDVSDKICSYLIMPPWVVINKTNEMPGVVIPFETLAMWLSQREHGTRELKEIQVKRP
jgi:hypothetical protein